MKYLLLFGFSVFLSITCMGCDRGGENLLTTEQEKSDVLSNEENESTTKNNKMKITIQSKEFNVSLENNATAADFYNLLPLELTMNELNGNEKYFYLNTNLHTNATKPGTIHAGDIMLYGANCIVVFYKTFTSAYSYTPIGHIDNPENLDAILGKGNVSVHFSK